MSLLDPHRSPLKREELVLPGNVSAVGASGGGTGVEKGKVDVAGLGSTVAADAAVELKPKIVGVAQQSVLANQSQVGGRVAVCVTGQPRTMAMPPDDPDYPANWGPMRVPKGTPMPAKLNMTCAQTLHANLYPTLATRGFDVFMLITTLPSDTSQKHNLRMVKPEDLSACDPLRPTDSTNELFCRVEVEPDLSGDLREAAPFWNRYSYNDHKHKIQLLHQLWDQRECLRMVEETGRDYSHIIRLRPDSQMRKPLPTLQSLDFGSTLSTKRTLFSVGKQICCCGNEDWFLVGTTDAMSVFFQRYDFLMAVQGVPDDKLAVMAPSLTKQAWAAVPFALDALQRSNPALSIQVNTQSSQIDNCLVKPKSRATAGTGAW